MTRDEQPPESNLDAKSTRRRFLGGAAAAATVTLAGCSSILGGDAGDPEAAVEEFYTALGDGNTDRVNELLHPDANAGELTDEQVSQFEQLDFSVDETELVEEDGDRAVVSVTITTTIQDQEQTSSQELELRTHEGSWRIYGAPSN